MSEPMHTTTQRYQLERQLGQDLRILTSESDGAARRYADDNAMSYNDFRGVVFAVIAEMSGQPLSAGELRRRLGVSGAAVTYLMDRMTEMGHLRMSGDSADRRKTRVHPTERGTQLARDFLDTTMERTYGSLASLTDADLAAAHRTFRALIEGMSAFRASTEGTGLDA